MIYCSVRSAAFVLVIVLRERVYPNSSPPSFPLTSSFPPSFSLSLLSLLLPLLLFPLSPSPFLGLFHQRFSRQHVGPPLPFHSSERPNTRRPLHNPTRLALRHPHHTVRITDRSLVLSHWNTPSTGIHTVSLLK